MPQAKQNMLHKIVPLFMAFLLVISAFAPYPFYAQAADYEIKAVTLHISNINPPTLGGTVASTAYGEASTTLEITYETPGGGEASTTLALGEGGFAKPQLGWYTQDNYTNPVYNVNSMQGFDTFDKDGTFYLIAVDVEFSLGSYVVPGGSGVIPTATINGNETATQCTKLVANSSTSKITFKFQKSYKIEVAKLISGDDQTWVKDSTTGLDYMFSSDVSTCTKAEVDGGDLTEGTDYALAQATSPDLSEYSTAATFTLLPDFLQTLEPGNHTLRMYNSMAADGYLDATFTVIEPPRLTSGESSEWKHNSSVSLPFGISAPASSVTSVKVGDAVLTQNTDYSVTEGAAPTDMLVELNASYLNTLAFPADYTMTVAMTVDGRDYTVAVHFSVAEGDPDPPELIAGDGSNWVKGSSSVLTFKTTGPSDRFTGATVDGTALSASDYTVSGTSTIFELKASYLQNLSVGTHTLVIASSIGDVTATFHIFDAPTLLSGDNAFWVKGTTGNLTFVTSGPLDLFTGAQVGGTALETPRDYSAAQGTAAGTTALKLLPAYLQTLDAGDYQVVIESSIGDVTANFSVVNAPQLISGADQQWIGGQDTGLAFQTDGDFAVYTGIAIDGTTVAPGSGYTASAGDTSGTTKVQLMPAYLGTLTYGTHTLIIKSQYGDVSVTFKTIEPARLVSGGGQSWMKGSTVGMPFVTTGLPATFQNVQVNGIELTRGTDYTVTAASNPDYTLVELKSHFLESLDADTHSIMILSSMGNVTATFIIEEGGEPIGPELTAGDESRWVKGSGRKLMFRSTGDFDTLTGVLVDDTRLQEGDEYEAVEGSTIVYLLPDYLETLEAGEHHLVIESTGGDVDATFYIDAQVQPEPEPDEPDEPAASDEPETKLPESYTRPALKKSPKTSDGLEALATLDAAAASPSQTVAAAVQPQDATFGLHGTRTAVCLVGAGVAALWFARSLRKSRK